MRVQVGPCALPRGGDSWLLCPPVLEPVQSPTRRMVLIKTIETRDGQVRGGLSLHEWAPTLWGHPYLGCRPHLHPEPPLSSHSRW